MQWAEDWLSASVVNHNLMCDPTIWQPGNDLSRQSTNVEAYCQTGLIHQHSAGYGHNEYLIYTQQLAGASLVYSTKYSYS